jgi:hypothetical protein
MSILILPILFAVLRDEFIRGITLDNVDSPERIVASLRTLRKRPMARIVFDPEAGPAFYQPKVRAIREVASVLGTPIDSAPPSGKLTVAEYTHRMTSFMDALDKDVDIWEIGNEVNGDWTCQSAVMGSKIDATYLEAKKRHKRTALTLFYSDAFRGTEREMVTWSREYLTERSRTGIDYVLVSFYPDSATGVHPDWNVIFRDLASTFPTAKIGFGELGLRKADFTLSENLADKRALIQRYYQMPSPLPGRYIGGMFWWTYRQDAIEGSAPLIDTFRQVFR